MLAACYLNAVNIKRKIYRLENFARTSSIANESSRMAFYSTFLFITFKTLLSVRVFLQRCLPNSVLDEVTAHKMCQPWKESRDGVVVKALAFHKCASGSIPEPGARHKWVEFVVGSLHCPERFFSTVGTPVFTSPQKPTFSNSNSILYCVDIDFWTSSCTSLVLRM